MVGEHHIDKWSSPLEIDIIEGEIVQLPVNYLDDAPLKKHQASLLQYHENNYLHDLFNRIEISKSQSGTYKIITLKGLEPGDYQLKLNLHCADQKTYQITVHRGTYWQGNFILKKNNIL
jgi:hypothetical protein